MDDKVKIVSSGISADSLLCIIGIVFCILKGAGILPDSFTWVHCCIPFMIIAAELALLILGIIICAIVAFCMGFTQYDKED